MVSGYIEVKWGGDKQVREVNEVGKQLEIFCLLGKKLFFRWMKDNRQRIWGVKIIDLDVNKEDGVRDEVIGGSKWKEKAKK